MQHNGCVVSEKTGKSLLAIWIIDIVYAPIGWLVRVALNNYGANPNKSSL